VKPNDIEQPEDFLACPFCGDGRVTYEHLGDLGAVDEVWFQHLHLVGWYARAVVKLIDHIEQLTEALLTPLRELRRNTILRDGARHSRYPASAHQPVEQSIKSGGVVGGVHDPSVPPPTPPDKEPPQ